MKAGTRVVFSSDLGALLSYPNPPMLGSEGVVVPVRFASGEALTGMGDRVFVSFGRKAPVPVQAAHLTPATSRRASMDLSGFFGGGEGFDVEASTPGLVKKSVDDFWQLQESGGGFEIVRLVDDQV